MKAFVCALAVVLAICSVAMGKEPRGVGIKLALNQKSIDFFLDKAMPVAYRAIINAVVLPDLSATLNVPEVGNVNVTLKKMKITSFEKNSAPRGRAHNENGKSMLEFKQNMMTLDMDLKWYYVLEDKSSNYGTGVIYIDSDWGGDVYLMTDASGHPTTKFLETGVGVGRPTIKLSGGPDWLNEAVATNFNDAIIKVIRNSLMDVIRDVIEPGLNRLLAQAPLQLPIDKAFSIDYTLVKPDGLYATRDGLLVANTAGEFFPTGGEPGNMPGEFPTDMPNNATGQQFQIFFSENSIGSFFITAVESGVAQIVLSKDMFSSYFAELFTTGFFARYAPGIVAKYGNGTEVVFSFVARKWKDSMFDKSGFGLRMVVDVTVRAQNNSTGEFEDAFTLALNCEVDGIVKVDDVKIFGDISELTAPASLVSSNVGDVDVDAINNLIEFGVAFGLNRINKILEEGTPIPELPHVKLVHPTIVYDELYAVFSTDVLIH